jgi:hypothetical protein
MTAPTETAPNWSRGTDPATAPVAPSPADMPPTQPAAAAPTEQGEQPDTADTPSEESKAMAKLRKENADWRTKLRAQEEASAAALKAAEASTAESASLKDMLAKLSAVLNPDANTPPDPAQLAEQLTAAQAETARVAGEKDQMIRNLTIRASLPSALAKASADPGLTEAVLTANGVLAKLDPSSDTFAADLESAVAAAVEANPRLKVDAPVAPSRRSGAEIPGRSGGSDQLTRAQLAGMSSAQIEKARADGRLKNVLSGNG